MFLTGLSRSFLSFALCLGVAMVARAQASVEYGTSTSLSGSAAAKAKLPFPKVTLPAAKPAHGDASASVESGARAGMPSPEEAAAANRLALERKAGSEAAETSVRSAPNHALVWIDTQFVGATPITLKLAPGRHRMRLSAPNVQAVDENVELSPKQAREIQVSLTPRVAPTAAPR